MPWGDELGIGKGPPTQYERQLVGAALLLFVGAVALVMTARKEPKPGRFALVVAGVASLSAIALALTVRSTAMSNDQAHVLLGGGWMWMAAGACMSLGATASAVALRFAKPVEPPTKVTKRVGNKKNR